MRQGGNNLSSIENSRGIYEDFSQYESEELGMSLPPEAAEAYETAELDSDIPSSNIASDKSVQNIQEPQETSIESFNADAPDQYSEFDPGELTLEGQTKWRVGSGFWKQDNLRNVLVAAGRGEPWATQSLEDFFTSQLDTFRRPELNMSYADDQQNLASLFTQLRDGDKVAQTQAAKSLLSIILNQNQSDPELNNLLTGVLVAIQLISGEEISAFYDEVSALPKEKKQQLAQLAPQNTNPQWLKALGEAATHKGSYTTKSGSKQVSPTENSPEINSEGTQNISALATSPHESELATTAPQVLADKLSAASVMSAPSTLASAVLPTNPATVIGQAVEGILNTELGQKFLKDGATLTTRLSTLTQETAAAGAVILANTLYYATLAVFHKDPNFNNVNQHAEIRGSAAQLARSIVEGLGLSSKNKDLGLPNTDNNQIPKQLFGGRLLATEIKDSLIAVNSSRPEEFVRIAPWHIAPENLPMVTPGTVVNTSTAAAGMAAAMAGLQRTFGASALLASNDFGSLQPSYFIEGPGVSPESRDGSGGQNDQNDDEQSHAQPSETFALV